MTDSTHLFVLTTDFKPMTGGVAEYLHQLWNHVARRYPVTLMSTVQCGENIWEHDYRFEQLPPLPDRRLGERFGDSIPFLRKLQTGLYFIRLRRYARRAVTRIRRHGSNCEAFIGMWDVASHFLCQELHSAGIPYSLHAHGLDVISRLYGRLPEWRKRDFCNARVIFACSSATAGLVRDVIGDRVDIVVVYPGVDPKTKCCVTTLMIDRLKSELSLGTGPILLTVARLVRRKGIDQVLRCIPDLVRKHPGLQYVVAGEGPEKVDLLQLSSDLLIEEHVRFLGLTEESTKWALYSVCDLFIMPNRLLNGEDWEGFGIVFMEAALCGKPAIGGRNGGVPEAIEDCVTGLLVDSEKVDSIRDTVLLLLDNAESRGRMGLRARERGEEKFNWLAIAEAFQKRLPGR